MQISNKYILCFFLMLISGCSDNNVAVVEKDIRELKNYYDLMATSLVNMSYAFNFGINFVAIEKLVAEFEEIEKEAAVLQDIDLSIDENKSKVEQIIHRLDALRSTAVYSGYMFSDESTSFTKSFQQNSFCEDKNFYQMYNLIGDCFIAILGDKVSAQNYLDSIVSSDNNQSKPSRIMPFLKILAENTESFDAKLESTWSRVKDFDQMDELMQLGRNEDNLKRSFATICNSTTDKYQESRAILRRYLQGLITLEELDEEILKEEVLIQSEVNVDFVNATKYIFLKNGRDVLITGRSSDYALNDLMNRKIPNLIMIHREQLRLFYRDETISNEVESNK